jgi:hypothetical protein
MNSIKCPRCGLVNWGTPPACKRCGASFHDVSEQAYVSVPAGEHPYAPHSVEETEQTRKVWRWFVIYCVLMTALYVLTAGIGVALLVLGTTVAPSGRRDSGEVMVQGVVTLVIGLVFIVPYGLGPFVKGKPWGWVYGIVLIALGMTSCCLWPITIPLIIQWVKPEMKRFFGKFD